MRQALLALFVLLSAVPCALATPPSLFFYPLPHHFASGQRLPSPQTMGLEQITTRMPLIPQASGVVLMVYWSTLCPEAGRCDFNLIDRALAYWQQRRKKLVLDVATEGFPIMTPSGVQSATPEWVLRKVRTYARPARLLGEGRHEEDTVMPDFRDREFVAEVAGLVRLLQRYDGNPTIAQIRIGTGLMGEDNPLIGPVMRPIAGFSERAWLDYTRRVAAVYFETFHRTQLEFDIGRLSWMAARGSPSERDAVDRFVGELLSHRVLLAFDGLSSESLRQIERPEPRNGEAQSLEYLREYKAHGGQIGLEAIGHAAAPRMRDTQAVAAAVRAMQPDRLVLFSDAGEAREKLDQLLTALGYR